MMWKFINFQLKKWREHSQNQASKRKTVSPKSKPHKRDPARGESSCAIVYMMHLLVFFFFLGGVLTLSHTPFPSLGLLCPIRRRYQRSREVRRQNISAGQKGQSLVELKASEEGEKSERSERRSSDRLTPRLRNFKIICLPLLKKRKKRKPHT